MARWRSGAVAQWRGGAMARWRSGAVAQWRGGAVALASDVQHAEPGFKSFAAVSNLGQFVHLTVFNFTWLFE